MKTIRITKRIGHRISVGDYSSWETMVERTIELEDGEDPETAGRALAEEILHDLINDTEAAMGPYRGKAHLPYLKG